MSDAAEWMANAAHVVMVMADDSDYPSRVFESLIEAKAFAMAKQERAGGRVYVVSVPLVRAAEDVTFNGEPVTPDDGDMLARSDYRRFLTDPDIVRAWNDAPDQRAQQ